MTILCVGSILPNRDRKHTSSFHKTILLSPKESFCQHVKHTTYADAVWTPPLHPGLPPLAHRKRRRYVKQRQTVVNAYVL